MTLHMFNKSLVHQQGVRTTRHVGMNCQWKNKVVILAIKVVKMVAPNVLHISCVYKSMAVGSILDEHHRRQIVKVPCRQSQLLQDQTAKQVQRPGLTVCRNLNQASLLALDTGAHPVARLLGIVYLGPGVAGAQIVRLAVVVAHAVVVLDAVVEEKLSSLFACFPPRRNTATRRLAAEFSEHAVRLVQNLSLLIDIQAAGVLVGVAMQADFMSSIANRRHVFWECLETVAGNEPCCLDVVFGKKLQYALHSHSPGKVACRKVRVM